jgi:hypothetical protein
MPPLLTEAEVAKRLALSVRSVSRMRTAGGGPRYLKINHSVRYARAISRLGKRHSRGRLHPRPANSGGCLQS